MEKEWDETAHPRHPEGDPRGGQFAPKDESGDGAQVTVDYAGEQNSIEQIIATHVMRTTDFVAMFQLPGCRTELTLSHAADDDMVMEAEAYFIDSEGNEIGECAIRMGAFEHVGTCGYQLLELLEETIRAIRASGTDVLTVGQYLRPSPQHLPVRRYYTPQEFDKLRAFARGLGFAHVESGPLVRSSYHAESHLPPKA